MKRLILIAMLISILSGCTAVMYGYDSLDYEKQLVGIDSEKGQRRMKQIVDFDPAAASLLSTGYKPTHLYEVTSDDFYFISADGKGRHYHLVRGEGVSSIITEVKMLPPESLKTMPLHYPIMSKQSQNKSVIEGAVDSRADTPVASKEAVASEPKPESKPAPPPKPLDKAYHIKGTHPTISISGYTRKPSIKPREYKNYEYVVVGQVLEDKTVRGQDDFTMQSQKVRTGMRRVPNPNHVRAQLDMEQAQRRYIEAVNQSNKPVGGVSNGLAFLTGMVRQKTLNNAEEALYDAKMRAMRESEYVDEPVYEQRNQKVYWANLERSVKVKLTKYQGASKVGEVVLTKKFSGSANRDDPAAINATKSRLNRKTVILDLNRVTFN